MSKAIYFDEAGEPQGVANFVYDEDAQTSGGILIPEDTDDQTALDTWYFKNGEIKVRDRRPSQYHFWQGDIEQWIEDLTYLRKDSLRKIDDSAETARAEYATLGSGQAMVYETKYREALAGGGPILQAEADALGETLADVVQSVLDARAEWEAAMAHIEAVRRCAKRDIRNAETASEMHAIVKALDFTVP